MRAEDKAKEQTIKELRQKIAELEKPENQQEIEKLLICVNKYKVLIEKLSQKIFYKNRNSLYVFCNGSYVNDLEIKPDEIVGKIGYDFYIRKLAEKYRTDNNRIIESGKTEKIEEKYIQNGQEVITHTKDMSSRMSQSCCHAVIG